VSDDNIVPFRPNIPDRELKEGTIGERTRGGQIIRAKRRTRILELRAAGLTEYQIAEELDMSQSAVSRTINSQLDEWMQEDANHVERIRAMKLYELDQLKRAVWAKALKGDLRAVQQATKIVQAQARIAGAEAPRKVETKTEHSLLGIDADEVGQARPREPRLLRGAGPTSGPTTQQWSETDGPLRQEMLRFIRTRSAAS
jgi:predicted transcriptional regulator